MVNIETSGYTGAIVHTHSDSYRGPRKATRLHLHTRSNYIDCGTFPRARYVAGVVWTSGENSRSTTTVDANSSEDGMARLLSSDVVRQHHAIFSTRCAQRAVEAKNDRPVLHRLLYGLLTEYAATIRLLDSLRKVDFHGVQHWLSALREDAMEGESFVQRYLAISLLFMLLQTHRLELAELGI